MLIQAFNCAVRKSREKRTMSGEGPVMVVVCGWAERWKNKWSPRKKRQHSEQPDGSEAVDAHIDSPPSRGPGRPIAANATLTHAHDVPVVMPYRLDLTVSVLRRLSTNVADLLTSRHQ